MRINVYAEELTSELELVGKTPSNHPGVTFYGVRMFLASPKELHHSADDDDRSAITFWIPWTAKAGNKPETVQAIFQELARLASEVPAG